MRGEQTHVVSNAGASCEVLKEKKQEGKKVRGREDFTRSIDDTQKLLSEERE